MNCRLRSDVDVELIKHSAYDRDVVLAAQVSTKGEASLHDAQNEGNATRLEGLIQFLMRERHGTPFEHSVMTFYISAPIFVFRELMRHRIASFNEESGRYRKLQPVFYLPDADRPLVQTGPPGRYEYVAGSGYQFSVVDERTLQAYAEAYSAYEAMLEAGIAREVARQVLPVGLYSSLYMTINARSLMNLLSLRTKNPHSTFPSYPQHEITMVADRLEQIWADLMPVTHQAFCRHGRVAP